ncbi:angiopoietin-related protein 1-like [Wyeomyia smithii]|uniref:angiopoietin-related protein 1-like n=1 Tax=Wyeomyia smithii TaxID=174621 RepID=UPI002467E2D1|nr:angiopoietin-related protein 1-like [Wyeomyia smithii]
MLESLHSVQLVSNRPSLNMMVPKAKTVIVSCLFLAICHNVQGIKYLSDLIANLNKTCNSLENWQSWMNPAKGSLPPIGSSLSHHSNLISSCKKVPIDASGVYLLQPQSDSVPYPYPVYCDHESFIGSHGWIVIQNRQENGRLNFDRNWAEYKEGFGDPNGEFWLGLEKLHQLLKHDRYELLIVMKAKDGKMEGARYGWVTIAGENDGYRLDLGTYAYGSAGPTMEYSRGAKFSTPDRNNDGTGRECADQLRSGWWFRDCRDLPDDRRVKNSKNLSLCDKQHHPYDGNFFMGDNCLAETRMLIREL